MQRNFQKGQGTGGRPGPEPLTEIHVFPPETALNSDPPGLPLWVGDGGLGGWVTMSVATGSGLSCLLKDCPLLRRPRTHHPSLEADQGPGFPGLGQGPPCCRTFWKEPVGWLMSQELRSRHPQSPRRRCFSQHTCADTHTQAYTFTLVHTQACTAEALWG